MSEIGKMGNRNRVQVDTILYNSSANIDALQEDLTILEQWEQKWDMLFNATKCKHILFSRKRTPSEHPLTIIP